MKVRQCCCGCTLKTGTIIIGVLNILGGVANLIAGIEIAEKSESFDADRKEVFVGIGSGLAVLSAILLLVAIYLIIGAQKGTPVLLVPWMVYIIAFLIANTVLYIFIAERFFAKVLAAIFGYITIIGVVIYLLLQTYFLLVVYSLYRELKGRAPPKYASKVRLNKTLYGRKFELPCLPLQLG